MELIFRVVVPAKCPSLNLILGSRRYDMLKLKGELKLVSRDAVNTLLSLSRAHGMKPIQITSSESGRSIVLSEQLFPQTAPETSSEFLKALRK